MTRALALRYQLSAGVVILVLFLPLATASAQMRSVQLTADYRSWIISGSTNGLEERISQFSSPFAISLGLHPRLDLSIRTGGATAALDPIGRGQQDLAGMEDVYTQLSYRAARGHLLLDVGANLPTGKKELSEREFSVASGLGNPLVGFRTKTIGEGFNLTGTATVGAQLFQGVFFAFGTGFVNRGSYQLLQEGGDYQPASEVSVSAGLDFGARSSSLQVHLDGTARRFGTDEIDGISVYEQGDVLDLLSSLEVRGQRARTWVSSRLVTQNDDTRFLHRGGSVSPEKRGPGTALFFRSGLDRSVGSGLRAGLEFEWNRHTGSEFEGVGSERTEGSLSADDGDVFGLGPRIEFPWGDHKLVRTRFLVSWGSLETDADDVRDLKGILLTTDFFWVPARRNDATPNVGHYYSPNFAVRLDAVTPPTPEIKETAIETQPIPVPAILKRSYLVHVSSFRGQTAADEEARRLQAARYPTRTSPEDIPGRGDWVRVFVGPYDDEQTANDVARDFQCGAPCNLSHDHSVAHRIGGSRPSPCYALVIPITEEVADPR